MVREIGRRSDTDLVDVHIKHGEEGIWISLATVCFYGGANEGLGQDEVGELVGMEELYICLEELEDEPLEGDEVDIRIGIEKLKVDVDEVLLVVGTMSRKDGAVRTAEKTRTTSSPSLSSLLVGSSCFRFDIGSGAGVESAMRDALLGRRSDMAPDTDLLSSPALYKSLPRWPSLPPVPPHVFTSPQTCLPHDTSRERSQDVLAADNSPTSSMDATRPTLWWCTRGLAVRRTYHCTPLCR